MSATKLKYVQNNKGITLIELILSVAMILVLGFMSTSYYSRALLSNAVTDTSDRFVSELRKAQLYSMEGKNNTTWGVRYGSSQITLFASSSSAFDEKFYVNTNVSVTGFTQVVFAKITGEPNSSQTINISSGNKTSTITVNSMGAVNR